MPEHIYDLLKLGLNKKKKQKKKERESERKKNSESTVLAPFPRKNQKAVSGGFPIGIMFQNSVLECF